MDASQEPQVVSEVKEQQNNNETPPAKPLTGFQLHPENINRNGAPKRSWTWKDLIEEAAEEMMEVKGKDGTTSRKALKYLVARKLLTAAAGGNVNAARELMNRTDGMPTQPVEHTGEVKLNVNEMLEKVYGETKPDSTT